MERHYLLDCQINVFHSYRGHPVLFLYIDRLRQLLRRLGGQRLPNIPSLFTRNVVVVVGP